jgi:hypothetical protein
MGAAWRGLVGSDARTDPGSRDPRLRGRTYAIPFDRVWTAALSLADGGLRGWMLIHCDDVSGVLEAEVVRSLSRRVHRVHVRVGLDPNGQTRVDASVTERVSSLALGGSRRRLRSFLAALDERLAATPGQILDPTPETTSVG